MARRTDASAKAPAAGRAASAKSTRPAHPFGTSDKRRGKRDGKHSDVAPTTVPPASVPPETLRSRQLGESGNEPTRGTGLAVGSQDLRVAALLRQRELLLRKIAAKGRERERLHKASEEITRALKSTLPPIFLRQQQISAELRKLFQAFLAGQLSKSAKRQLRDVYLSLCHSGYITDAPEQDDEHPEFDDSEGSAPASAPPFGRPRGERQRAEPEHPSADHGGQWAHAREGQTHGPQSGDALRSSFRRIAAALHPDRVQSEADKRVRTELMKELTRAYETGDLALLLQIEERWSKNTSESDAPANLGSSWTHERVRSLERVIADLGSQLRAVMAEVRHMRRDSPLEGLLGVRPRSRAHQAELLAGFVSQANSELALAEDTLKFVRRFAAGELTLAQFLAGPGTSRGSREPDLDDLFEMLVDDFEDFARRGPPKRRRSR